MAKITMIPATRDFLTAAPINARRKRRVAAYARVSTDSDEQFTSYEAQVDYYTQLIRNNPDWVYVNVYTDEGIDLFAFQLCHHRLAERVVYLFFPGIHADRHLVDDAFRHGEEVAGLHGDGDIRDPVVDGLLCSGCRFVAVHHLGTAFIRQEEPLTVAGNEPTEAFSHISFRIPPICSGLSMQ